ncbi:MAG: VRR-NUC domain-containing protein [Pseudomonadota bacterium]
MNWKAADIDDPVYYWKNFQLVQQWVTKYHDNLISPSLAVALEGYDHLSSNAQKLWLRLYSRKGYYLRSDRLNYPEIEVASAIDELAAQNWLTFANSSSQSEWLPQLLKPELIALAKKHQLQVPSAADKRALLDLIMTQEIEPPITILQLEKKELFSQLALLFFGNSRQQLSEFVVTALGHRSYENYKIRPRGVFRNFDDFQLVLKLLQWQKEYKELESPQLRVEYARQLPLEKLAMSVPAHHTGKFSRFLNKIGRDAERAADTDFAMDVYALSQRSPSRERRVRLLKKVSEPEQARQLLEQMQAQPWDEPELAIATQLYARWFCPDDKSQLAMLPKSQKSLAFTPRKIEQAVLNDYCKKDWEGDHCENLIPQILFGLCFWDIIFADIDGAFVHPFQRGPRDLTSQEFYQNRKSLIDKRIHRVKTHPEQVLEEMKQAAVDKQGLNNPFIPWKLKLTDLAINWFSYLPSETWAQVFERIAFDVKNNRSGFPDLWLQKNNGEQVLLVEVKGPGDTLRANQSRWLSYLQALGVPIKLVTVQQASGEPFE